MASFNPYHEGAFMYPYNAHGYWSDQSVPLLHFNNMVDDSLNMIDYTQYHSNTSIFSFPTIVPSYLPPYAHPPPLQSSNPQPSIHQPIFNAPIGSNSYYPLPAWEPPPIHLSAEPRASLSTSASMTTTTNSTIAHTATQSVSQTTSISKRARFACSSCGKRCTDRPRAEICFNNHIRVKPFACNGDCGITGW
jgi:hypothetical protein